MNYNKKIMLAVIAALAIGFAAVSTTLYLTGTLNIGANLDDYDVYFSNAKVNGVEDKSVITDDTHITFEASLKDIGEEYELEYFITNGSRNYDSAVSMNCTSTENEYLSITNTWVNPTTIEATDTLSGILKATMTKGYVEEEETEIEVTCNITADAVSRTSLGEGTIVNTSGTNFSNVVISDESTIKKVPKLSHSKALLNSDVTLNNINDVYEFTVDVVNNDDVDNMIKSINKTTLTSEQSNVFDLSIKYEGGSQILERDLLDSNSSKTLKVTLKYKNGVTASDIATVNKNIGVNLSLDYEEADENALKTSTLLEGPDANIIMKRLANVNAKDDNVNDNIITSISFVHVDTLPDGGVTIDEEGNAVATLNGTDVVISTLANRIVLNENSTNLFCGFNNVSSVDFDILDPSNVTNMRGLFAVFAKETTLINGFDIVYDWDVSNVSNMSIMFDDFGAKLENFTLDLRSWDVSNVEILSGIFISTFYSSNNCSILIEGWHLKKDVNLSSMFTSTGGYSTNFYLNANNMFFDNVTKADGLFNTIGFASNNLRVDFSNVTMYGNPTRENMFSAITGENTYLNLSNFNAPDITNYNILFAGTFSKPSITVDLSNWNTSNVTDMSRMFSGVCSSSNARLNIIGIEDWDTSNVTNMEGMFSGFLANYTGNDKFDLSGWNVSKVTNHSSFYGGYGNPLIEPNWVN